MTHFNGIYRTTDHDINAFPQSDPITVHHFDSENPGPHLLMLSGIHAGTESIPTAASYTAINMIKDGMLPLTRGKITFIPLCNPLALIEKKRFVDVNLNRVMHKHDTPKFYEEHIANIITDYIDDADAVIDLHTQSTPSVPFLFNDYPQISSDLARSLNIKIMVTGWPEAFATKDDLFNDGDTSSYACTQNIPSVCVECGYNKDPMAAVIALKTTILGMKYLGITEDIYTNKKTIRHINIQEGISMPEKAEFVKEFYNFEAVAKGTPLLQNTQTKETIISAPYDCVLVLPKKWASPGIEAFFYAIEKEDT